MILKKFISPLAFIMLFAASASVQAESEGQRMRAAEKLFVAKQYDKATPLFAQLVSSNPKSYKYNYYYGICMLITGKDKTECIPYLEAAVQNPKTPEDIYYYLGRSLHLTYQFNDAMNSFTEFVGIIGGSNAGRWQIPTYLENCNNAKKILDTTRNSEITASVDCKANEFYKNYEFTNPNGKLLSMPDEVIKNSNSESDERPMIFLSANNRVMYYSAKSAESDSRDIYRVEKDMSNNWGTPERLSNMVNTNQDELFPTCNVDGRILYFSSRGHNSTGGFDIFKAYYNTVSKTWSKAENMGSPVNSPDDDYCFVASSEEEMAYFSSQRASGPGDLTVYKMKYANREELPVALNGKFNCIGQPDLKEVHLLISRDGETNVVADLMTDKKTGTYAVELPGPGTYEFKVEAEGFSPHTEHISFNEFSDNIFVQDILLSRNYNGKEDMAITSRRLSDSGLLDASLTANADVEGGTNSGLSAEEMKMAAALGATSSSTSTGDSMRTMYTDMTNVPMIAGIQFKVQIGAFHKTSKKIVDKRLAKKTDPKLLTNYYDITWLRYFIGGEKSYVSAKNLKYTLVQAGFKDAFVVAFKNAKPMNLQEAIKQSTSAQ